MVRHEQYYREYSPINVKSIYSGTVTSNAAEDVNPSRQLNITRTWKKEIRKKNKTFKIRTVIANNI